ncbi:MAG TPA: heparan-alpha-glucosaminide N-acetyltransferase domain-containing protein, partial [Anaeromyxobacteraceae bacterium]|nr:heparan-alpha-glucosaminide N-acetyltransferase domain-containing protein [Anaeromyxobacteraceae bacterium]
MPTPSRRHWLDWQRGLAVLLMVEVHVLDAWLASDVQRTGLHRALDLLGGLAAPGFLFMAGISVVLADAALERKGLSRPERSARLLRRAGWLLGVALLFRGGEYLLGGMWRVPGGWRDILRVDVLNVIAVSLAVTVCAAVALPRRAQLPVTAALAAAIALATPPLAASPHQTGPLVDYLLPPTGGEFAFFN